MAVPGAQTKGELVLRFLPPPQEGLIELKVFYRDGPQRVLYINERDLRRELNGAPVEESVKP
jgi:hypothetical protein